MKKHYEISLIFIQYHTVSLYLKLTETDLNFYVHVFKKKYINIM